MKKLKSVFQSKKFWTVFLLLVLVVALIILFFIFKNTKTIEHIENPYEVWLDDGEKINLIIRFKEEYDECYNDFKTSICSDKTLKITELEIIEEDLKDTFVNGTSNLAIEDIIISFLSNAYEQGREWQNIRVITDYEFDLDFENTIKEHFSNVNIEFLYGGLSYTGELEDTYLYHTVNFDSSGGSNIDSVVVKEGEVVKEPDAPTKEGYTFVRWTLDGEEYDFSMPITEEITLTAVWEVEESSSDNPPSNQTTNENANNEVVSSKINLNNNISITEYHVNDGTMNCFHYMFVTNLKEVFPGADITKINNNPTEVAFWYNKDRQDYEVSLEEINEYLTNGTLKINTSAENNFKNVLNKYKNGNYKGIASVSYTEENHRFSFSYDYISFNGLNVSSNGESANKEIQNALSSSTKFNGPCGSASSYENKILTEELCNKYNLDCDRW